MISIRIYRKEGNQKKVLLDALIYYFIRMLDVPFGTVYGRTGTMRALSPGTQWETSIPKTPRDKPSKS